MTPGLLVLRAPPFATVQDLGWTAGRGMGLPPGGAMDPEALALANRLVGNAPDDAAIEWALGPGSVRLERPGRVSVTGDAAVQANGTEAGPWRTLDLPAGGEITVTPGGHGRFVYVAVDGGIATPRVAGSRSTYLPAGLGGREGRRLKSGDRLPLGSPPPHERLGPASARLQRESQALRVTVGPQADRFPHTALAALTDSEWTVLPASDRMGYRLAGPVIAPRDRANLPSEAACPGAIQVPDNGQPIVLMPDGPTVGGYLKLAVVAQADLGRLAQCPPGRAVRFRIVSADEARAALRTLRRDTRPDPVGG